MLWDYLRKTKVDLFLYATAVLGFIIYYSIEVVIVDFFYEVIKPIENLFKTLSEYSDYFYFTVYLSTATYCFVVLRLFNTASYSSHTLKVYKRMATAHYIQVNGSHSNQRAWERLDSGAKVENPPLYPFTYFHLDFVRCHRIYLLLPNFRYMPKKHVWRLFLWLLYFSLWSGKKFFINQAAIKYCSLTTSTLLWHHFSVLLHFSGPCEE